MAENKRIKLAVNWLISQGVIQSQQELGELCGVPNKSYLSQLVNGRAFNREFINKFTALDDRLNESWLLTGEGEMLKSDAEAEFSADAVINYEKGVPYYDEDFVLGFNELGFPSSENPQFLVQMPKYPNATLWCNATGNSMEPEISSGDVIALQLIEDPSFLLHGELYAIVTTNGLRTIKRLERGSDVDHYTLVPTNPAYQPQEIPKSRILRVFRVLGNLHSF